MLREIEYAVEAAISVFDQEENAGTRRSMMAKTRRE
jgi:hypothetical protein